MYRDTCKVETDIVVFPRCCVAKNELARLERMHDLLLAKVSQIMSQKTMAFPDPIQLSAI
mgnify:CR=1 FL=1|jgi:hypothetical protein